VYLWEAAQIVQTKIILDVENLIMMVLMIYLCNSGRCEVNELQHTYHVPQFRGCINSCTREDCGTCLDQVHGVSRAIRLNPIQDKHRVVGPEEITLFYFKYSSDIISSKPSQKSSQSPSAQEDPK
jgi:hypothetical protein